MKTNTMWLAVFLVFLAAEPASAWFWEKQEVKTPAVNGDVDKDSSKIVKHAGADSATNKTGGGVKGFFKGIGKNIKETSKAFPGEAKKSAKEVGQSFKATGKDLAKGTKKVPGALKKGAGKFGKAFKKLGSDPKSTEQVHEE